MKKENNTPTNCFNAFIIARKDGDIETIKGTLTKDTLVAIEKVSAAQKKTFSEALNVVGNKIYIHFVFAGLPITRNETIAGDVACLESKNRALNKFDAFVFQKEEGVWKLALDCEIVGVMRDESISKRLINFLKDAFKTFFVSDNEIHR